MSAATGCEPRRHCSSSHSRIALALDQPVRIERGYHLCYAVQGRERPALVAWREWLLEQCRRGSHHVAADTAPKFS